MVIELKGAHFEHNKNAFTVLRISVKEIQGSDTEEPLLLVNFLQGFNDACSFKLHTVQRVCEETAPVPRQKRSRANSECSMEEVQVRCVLHVGGRGIEAALCSQRKQQCNRSINAR